MNVLIVSYPKDGSSRFDRDHYLATHMPLVARIWGPHGLDAADAYYPEGPDARHHAVTIIRFRDAAAVDAAMGDGRTGEVLADIANFTDGQPVIERGARA